MAQNRLFFSQDVLDTWVDERKVSVEGNILALNEEEIICQLVPAVYFLRESTGADDGNGLVGRVKEEETLAALGVDLYMDSALVEENAYDIQRGFVALPLAQEIPLEYKDTIPDDSLPPMEELEADPTEELAALLLKHLR